MIAGGDEEFGDLFFIDVLPAQCGVIAEGSTETGLIRFMAYRALPEEIEGPWTNWVKMENCPIRLIWQELWPGGDPINN